MGDTAIGTPNSLSRKQTEKLKHEQYFMVKEERLRRKKVTTQKIALKAIEKFFQSLVPAKSNQPVSCWILELLWMRKCV
jgi:hypothetical protein